MLMTAAERPTASALSAWTWIDSTPDGLVSMVLITPSDASSPGLGSLAARAGLLPPHEPLPAPGLRLVLHEDHAMAILPRAETALRFPTDEGWSDFARRGGTVVVILGEHPLEIGADRSAVERYLLRAMMPRQIWLGKTTVAADYAPSQVRGETCIVCGAGGGLLHPVGYAYTPTVGAPLGWPVVAHSTCPSTPTEER
ncbi:hypothetical protein ACFVYP_07135 [Kitasatospora sp. NPDC058201]|uniref:hypothetical protein n=1 Tax=unclassified Kitasatospora TaxID=2633591 RepID=UPI00364DDF5A